MQKEASKIICLRPHIPRCSPIFRKFFLGSALDHQVNLKNVNKKTEVLDPGHRRFNPEKKREISK